MSFPLITYLCGSNWGSVHTRMYTVPQRHTRMSEKGQELYVQ